MRPLARWNTLAGHMAAHLKFAHFCDFAYFDKFKKLSVISLWDDLQFTRMPGMIDRGALVFRIEGLRSGHAEVVIRATNKAGVALDLPATLSAEIPPNGTIVANLELNRTIFKDYGEYRFKISINGKLIATIPLNPRVHLS
jgi:hypothetical protein